MQQLRPFSSTVAWEATGSFAERLWGSFRGLVESVVAFYESFRVRASLRMLVPVLLSALIPLSRGNSGSGQHACAHGFMMKEGNLSEDYENGARPNSVFRVSCPACIEAGESKGFSADLRSSRTAVNQQAQKNHRGGWRSLAFGSACWARTRQIHWICGRLTLPPRAC